MDEPLTANEERAIRSLKRLAKTWPDSLVLFSQSGSLMVAHNRPGEPVLQADFIEHIAGIPNDGGDADG
jgi:hypothetical protein